MAELTPVSTLDDPARWRREPVRIAHTLHQHPLLSMESLARLIGRYPREHYSLVAMGQQGQEKLWREGDFGGLAGADVLKAIERGRLWINMRNVSGIDAEYRALLDLIVETASAQCPGFDAPKREYGILISSPGAQVYYHADLPGQCLWQIAGKKRVYLYPPAPPFITPRDLEDIALFEVEVDLPYSADYDAGARAFDLEPGQALHWPLNAPHRVENIEGMNISITVSYSTEEIHRANQVLLANAILRNRFGYTPKSRAITGPSYWSKRVLQKLLRDRSWVRAQRSARRPIEFKLDRTRLGEISDLKEAASLP
jgi:hypothetical protein